MERPILDTAKLHEVRRHIDRAIDASQVLHLPELLGLLGAASLAVTDELARIRRLERPSTHHRKAGASVGRLASG